MAARHEARYEITRVTRTIPRPYAAVLDRLNSSLVQSARVGTPATGLSILEHVESRATYEAAIRSSLGPHDFMRFQVIDHGRWMGLFGVHVGRRAVRLIFGNPLIAITMLQHDVQAGLFVPIEALVLERVADDNDGGPASTEIVYVLPSTLIAGNAEAGSGGEELRKAAQALDGKLEAFLDWVAEVE